MQMMNAYQRGWLKEKSVTILAGVFLLLLLLKFFWPFFRFDAPLGYDLGFYRYLFIRHADGFPPFSVAPMDEWAKGHPLGLFFFSTILLKLGMPVDWLLGWMWNLFPVMLAAVLAWVISVREGKVTGALVLLAAFLSISFFDGFAAMYWKTLASLFWCVLTYHFLERKSWWAMLTGVLCVATHHQTGLLFGLVFGTWVLLGFLRDARKNPRLALRAVLPFILGGAAVCLIGLLTYFPIWKDAVLSHMPALLRGEGAAAGSFPEAIFYLRTEGILLAFGAVGFFLSLKKERFTLWQLSVLWSFVFVAGRLLFYRRFFLQLDFFLLPFAAAAIRVFWMRFSFPVFRTLIFCALLLQTNLMFTVLLTRTPVEGAEDIPVIEALAPTLPADAFVLGIDNKIVTILRGWLPYAHVGGPGLFENGWSYQQWMTFLTGTHEERVLLLSTVPGSVYIYSSDYFMRYYKDGDVAVNFLRDSCFHPTSYSRLYSVSCPQ